MKLSPLVLAFMVALMMVMAQETSLDKLQIGAFTIEGSGLVKSPALGKVGFRGGMTTTWTDEQGPQRLSISNVDGALSDQGVLIGRVTQPTTIPGADIVLQEGTRFEYDLLTGRLTVTEGDVKYPSLERKEGDTQHPHPSPLRRARSSARVPAPTGESASSQKRKQSSGWDTSPRQRPSSLFSTSTRGSLRLPARGRARPSSQD